MEDLHCACVATLQEKLACLWRHGHCRAPSRWMDPARHVYRAYNKDADKLANEMTYGKDAKLSFCSFSVMPLCRFYAITFDGASG